MFVSCELNEGAEIKSSNEAFLEVSLNGKDDYENVWISIHNTSSSFDVLQKVDDDGSLIFNVSDYVNETLFVEVLYDDQGVFSVFDNTLIEVNIIEGNNDLSIMIFEDEVEVNSIDAEITIIGDLENVPDKIVYAIPSAFMSDIDNVMFESDLDIYSQAIVTNGVAYFEELDVTLSDDYHFIIVSQEKSGDCLEFSYRQLNLNLLENNKGRIDTHILYSFYSLSLFNSSGYDISNLKVRLYCNEDAANNKSDDFIITEGELIEDNGDNFYVTIFNDKLIFSDSVYAALIDEGNNVCSEVLKLSSSVNFLNVNVCN